jgi:hypothetical protein
MRLPIPEICSRCGDFDSFAFDLPTGTELAGISLAFVVNANNVSIAEADFLLCTGLITDPVSGQPLCVQHLLGTQQVSFLGLSPMVADFGGVPPIGAGIYTVLANGLGIAPFDNTLAESWSADYTWTFLVRRVPEPSSYALVSLALGWLYFVYARRSGIIKAQRSTP